MEIKAETKISVVLVGTLIAGIFSLFQILAPIFEQVELNRSKVEIHHEFLKTFRDRDKHINTTFMDFHGRLSRLETKCMR